MTLKSGLSFDNFLQFAETFGKQGQRRVLNFDGEVLRTYIKWADAFGFLLVDSDEFGINGLAIVYPVKKKFDKTQKWFYSFKDVPSKQEEGSCDICVMDFVAKDKTSRDNVINLFRSRFPNWESQRKYALIRGNPKEITTNFINKLYKHGLSISFSTRG